MKNISKGFSVAGLFMAIAAFFGLVHIATSTPATPISNPPASNSDISTDATIPAGWKTYTNDQYGFSIDYPSSDFVVATDLPHSQTMTYMGTCTRNAILCYLGPGTDNIPLDAASVAVSTDPSVIMQDCNAPNGHADTRQQVTISGVTFNKGDISEAGLGHHLWANSYRTYHNGSCYEIDIRIESHATPNNSEASQQFVALRNQLTQELENAVSTFKFIN
ncbi:MAG: hypothetical protein KGI45_03930 [Patescibacteria group bacterium]|nr:hypothetical protein [Patescibacteria group bacterium]